MTMHANAHARIKMLSLALTLAGGCATDDIATLAQESSSAAILLAHSGTGQDREVMSSFDPLVVTLTDVDGVPIPNAIITFTSPMAGASATFRFGGQAETDGDGRAELRPYATSIAGTYTVWAHADGATPMPFVLTNMPGAPAKLTRLLGSEQVRTVGMPFADPLTVEIRDNYGNLVADAPVQFVAPATGATTHMSEGGSAITDDEGRAAVFAVAGEMPGRYAVTANVPGAPAVSFELTNIERAPAFVPNVVKHVESLGTLERLP